MGLKLKIIDLDGIYFQDEVDLINLTIASGNVTILQHHIPLISSIDISHMYVKKNDITTYYAIAGGTLFVTESECKIITTAVEAKDEIDYIRADKAKQRALDRLNDEKSDNIDIKRAEVALKKAINRLSLR